MIGRGGMSISALLCENSSSRHMRGMIRALSSSIAGISSICVWNAPDS